MTDTTALATRPEGGHALERAPVYDRLNSRQIELLKTMSPNVSDAELAQGLELAFSYQLDPYAREIWFTKSKGRDGREGKLLIMVGKPGLRKVAQRNQLEVMSDLICENDEFEVELVDDMHDRFDPRAGGGFPYHRVTHVKRGVGRAQRGAVIGAWCRVVERHTKIQRGFFDAGIEEYDRRADAPGGDSHNPWNRQLSAMLKGAIERQAIGEATPLGGLLFEGEDQLVDVDVRADLPRAADALAGVERSDEVHEVIAWAKRLGHVGFGDVAAAQMTLAGASTGRVDEWLLAARTELARLEAAQREAAAARAPVDVRADELMAEQAARAVAPDPDDPGGQQAQHDPLEALRAKRDDVHERLILAESFDNEADAAGLRAELEQLEAEIASREGEGPGQGTLV